MLRRSTGSKRLPFIMLFLLLAATSFGQEAATFAKVKELAGNKQYEQAAAACNAILAKDDDSDVRFYLGLIYSWDGKYDAARKEFSIVEKSQPRNLELVNAQYNVEYWSGNYESAIKVLDRGIALYPKEVDLQVKKAKMLGRLGRKHEAEGVLQGALAVDPSSLEARNMLVLVKNSDCRNTVSLNYTVDMFSDNTQTWHSSYLQYGRRTDIGTVIGRVNYTNRYGTNGFQAEADSYLSFWKGGYTYANIGFSPSSVYPDFRCGFEYYQNLPLAFEASLGFRFLKFGSSSVPLYTGSVGKYYSNYWFSLRPMLRFESGKTSYSLRLASRRYFADPETYVGLEAGFGTAPDFDHPNIDYSYLSRLKSWSFRATYSQKLSGLWVVSAKAAFTRDEILKNLYRNQYEIDFTISKTF